MNKTLKVMASAAMLAGVVAPVATTTVNAANTKNIVDKVIYVADDYNAEGKAAGDVNNLFVRADDMNVTTDDTFRLSLPSGVKWVESYYENNKALKSDAGLTVVSRTDRDLELKANKTIAKGEEFKIALYFEVDGAEGEIKVTVDPRDSKVSGGQYTVAVVGEGKTTASIASVKTIKDGGTIDDIRIDETSIGALWADEYKKDNNKAQKFSLTLPSNYKWITKDAKVNLGGGFVGAVDPASIVVTPDDNKVTVEFKFSVNSTPSKIGTFYISGLAIDADKDAEYGEVEADLDGDKVTSGTLVVANYGDFGTEASLKGDVPTLLAGRLTDDKKDVETVEVTLKERVAGSWLTGRSVDVEFPSWVKVLGVDVSGEKNFDKYNGLVDTLFNGDIKGDSNEISFDLPADLKQDDNKKEFKVKFYVSTKANAEGDVTVKIGGRAGVEVPETVIAKVVAPVKVTTEKVDVRTGIKKQALKDIVITEATKGALLADKKVQLTLSDGEFTDEKPTITVKEGNVKIKEDTVSVEGGVLSFEIDGESTRASQIVVSGLSLDLNRAIPEGEVSVEVGGTALVQNDATLGGAYALAVAKMYKFGDKNYKDGAPTPAEAAQGWSDYKLDSDVDAGEFDQDYVTKAAVATVTTPAEGNVSAEKVTLTIGSSTMKVGDKEVAIDAAPYIEASTGRTYLPLRAIANAIGANSVEWDNASRTATVIKGGLVAQMTIGQNSYVLNGAKIGMDGKAQIASERTFLPIRALGNALGATVEWDAATQTVTIK
ncbi:copper amine oxidase N-terminal domain-containing protein [Schinkia sp. CFF1]